MEAAVGRTTQQIARRAGATWRGWYDKSKAAREWLEERETQLGWMQRVFKAWEAGHKWHQGDWDGGRVAGGENVAEGTEDEGELGRSWERLRYAVIRRKGGARRREERQGKTDRAEQEGEARVRDAWEGQEALGFVVSHETAEGRIFTDRMQVTKEARRKGVGEAMHARVVGGNTGEIHVRRANTDGRAFWARLGYEPSESEYAFMRQASEGRQSRYEAMRVTTAAADAPGTRVRGGIRYLTTTGAEAVPGNVWAWMRRQIQETDKVGPTWADRILTGGSEGEAGKQVYTIALRGRAEGDGRGCRLTEMRTYKETRDRRRNGGVEEGHTQCRLTIQMRVAHGWRLQRTIAAMRREVGQQCVWRQDSDTTGARDMRGGGDQQVRKETAPGARQRDDVRRRETRAPEGRRTAGEAGHTERNTPGRDGEHQRRRSARGGGARGATSTTTQGSMVTRAQRRAQDAST